MPNRFDNANVKYKDSVFRDYFNDPCRLLDLQWNFEDAKKAWFQEGRDEERYSIALNLLNMGMSLEKIQEATELSIEKIKELTKNKIER